MTKDLIMTVVDDNDEIIAYKDRSEVDFNKDIYRVSALWLTDSGGEILIAQRKLTKDRDPGMWGPSVAGTVEEGETYESNMYKETKEEIGLKDQKLSTGPKLRVYKPRNYFCQFFLLTLDKPAKEFVIQEDEVEQVKWISKDVLLKDLSDNPSKYIPAFTEVLRCIYG